MHALKNKMN